MSTPNTPHGGNGSAIASQLGLHPDDMIDLSASVNPFSPNVEAMAASALPSLRIYPDPTDATLRTASELGVEPDRVVLTNGGAEAIALVAHYLKRGATVGPEFSLYDRHLSPFRPSTPLEHTLDYKDNAATSPATAGTHTDRSFRWRSNPNNPLGHLAADTDEALVWDEAFYPLATGCWTRGDDRSWRVGSFTKVWGCPGLRLGYVIAPTSEEAQAIAALQPRWSVNGLALELLPQLFAVTQLDDWAQKISDLRRGFANDLTSLGYKVTESDANWVLIQDSEPLDTLTAPFGLVLRNCANFGLEGTFRVALPTPDQTDQVVSTFEKIRANG